MCKENLTENFGIWYLLSIKFSETLNLIRNDIKDRTRITAYKNYRNSF